MFSLRARLVMFAIVAFGDLTMLQNRRYLSGFPDWSSQVHSSVTVRSRQAPMEYPMEQRMVRTSVRQ